MSSIKPTQVKLSDVKSKLLRPALTSHFLCTFGIPSEPSGGGLGKFLSQRGVSFNSDFISLSCSEASLPGSSLATIDIENDYHGTSEKHAYRRLYDDRADFTFYVDRKYDIIKFFETWISYCVGENSLSGQVSREYFYRVNYPSFYKTDLLYITKFERDINTKDSANNAILEYKFINAYPININSIPVSYDTSQLLKCTVSFTYSRYVVTTLVNKDSDSFVNPNSNLSQATERALNPLSGPGYSDPNLERAYQDFYNTNDGLFNIPR